MSLVSPRRLKEKSFLLITLIMGYLIMEAVSYIVYSALYHRPFSFAEIKAHQTSLILAESKQAPVSTAHNVEVLNYEYALHPYLGYVIYAPKDPLWKDAGYFAEEDLLKASKDPENAIVIMTGASVATYAFCGQKNRDLLRSWLSKIPKFQNKKIVLGMLGAGAYHQPQQFLAVAYYLLQGGRLDQLINIDGAAEAMYMDQNISANIHPTYPQIWNQFFTNSPTTDFIASLGTFTLWKNTRLYTAQIFSHAQFSISLSTLWSGINSFLDYKVQQSEYKMTELKTKDNSQYATHGPSVKDTQDKNQSVEQAWEQGTIQLQYLAGNNHFDYFHFLQPSQYVPDSKPLTEFERENTVIQEKNKQSIQHHYPQFQEKIPALRAHGVNIFDLTQIFKTTKETIYKDKCCHINMAGEEIMMNAIGNHIIDYYQSKKTDQRL